MRKPASTRSAHPHRLLLVVAVVAVFPTAATADDREASFEKVVAPFFERHCTGFHGETRSKGGVVLHTLRAKPSEGPGPKLWDTVLDVLERGAMPPDSEKSPAADERAAVVGWMRAALRDELRPRESGLTVGLPTLRRLTNVEYQNTMRDLLGLELKLADDLPKDPFKPYTFTNTAEFMRLGPEQLDAYRDAARRAMASVIVDSEKPKAVKTRREWKPAATPAADGQLENHQLGVYGGRAVQRVAGVTVQSLPKAGEFRIRFQA
jgi:hypothetical protein